MVHHPPRETGSDDPLNKTAIRKKLHFTDERHDLVAAVRKYGVFADGPALPFRDTDFWTENGVSRQEKQLNRRKHVRDTGFLAEKGVSRQGKASISTKPARDTDFWTGKGVSLQEKQFNARKPVRDTGFLAEKGVSLQGKAAQCTKTR